MKLKHPAIVVALLVSLTHPSMALATSCKPDRAWTDTITKQNNFQWHHNLTASGFWGETATNLAALVLRWGGLNVINLQLTHVENDRDRLNYESQFRATKGDRFVFGLKDGEPLTFVAAEVSNNSQIVNAKGLVTTVILSAHLTDSDMGAFRAALTTKPIDAVRLFLASGQYDRAIEEKNGRIMTKKFSCFYQFLDKNGLVLSAPSAMPQTPPAPTDTAPPQDYASSAPGRYVTKGNTNDYIEYSADGTFFAQRGKSGFSGTYKVQADTVTMQMPTGQATRGRFSGSTIIDSDGIVWERQAPASPQRPAGAPLSLEQLTQMLTAKLPDDVIIKTIQKATPRLDVTPEALIKLKASGASDAVIRALTP